MLVLILNEPRFKSYIIINKDFEAGRADLSILEIHRAFNNGIHFKSLFLLNQITKLNTEKRKAVVLNCFSEKSKINTPNIYNSIHGIILYFTKSRNK